MSDSSSIICHNCGEAEQYRSDCVVLAKADGGRSKPAEQETGSEGGVAEVVNCA